jgi:hypothetical protein
MSGARSNLGRELVAPLFHSPWLAAPQSRLYLTHIAGSFFEEG